MNALAARLPPVPAPLPPIPPAPIGTVPHFGFLPDPFGPVVSCEPLPWPALAATVTMHAPGGKEGAAWMPARIEPGPRKTARVQAISALVMDVEAGRGASLEEVRDRVRSDWIASRRNAARDAFQAKMRSRYQIQIAWPKPYKGLSATPNPTPKTERSGLDGVGEE